MHSGMRLCKHSGQVHSIHATHHVKHLVVDLTQSWVGHNDRVRVNSLILVELLQYDLHILVTRGLCVSMLLLRCKYGVHNTGAVVISEVLLELFLDVLDLFFEVHES